MKKLIMSLMIIILILSAVKANELPTLPVDPPEWWLNATDIDRYNAMRKLSVEYVKIDKLLTAQEEKNKMLVSQLEKTNNILKQKNDIRFSFNISATATLDSRLQPEIFINNNYNIYIIKSRLYAILGYSIKTYKDIGAGITTGFGLNF